MKKNAPPAPPVIDMREMFDSPFSMEYRGELSKLLRLIADQLDASRAKAVSFTCGHSEDQFEMRCVIHTDPE